MWLLGYERWGGEAREGEMNFSIALNSIPLLYPHGRQPMHPCHACSFEPERRH